MSWFCYLQQIVSINNDNQRKEITFSWRKANLALKSSRSLMYLVATALPSNCISALNLIESAPNSVAFTSFTELLK